MKKKEILMTIGLVFVIVLSLSLTFGRYISNTVVNHYLESKGFYLSSDNLATNGLENYNNDWDQTSVYFNVKNSKNDYLITEYDINYKVKCTVNGDAASNVNCKLNGTEYSTITATLSSYSMCINNTTDGVDVSSYNKSTCELNGYDYEVQVAESNLYFDIEPVDGYIIKDIDVTIEVESTDPYSKTIYGDFILNSSLTGDNNIVSNYTDYTAYGRLDISNTYLTDKCVSVSWNPNYAIIDDIKGATASVNGDNYINNIVTLITSKSAQNYMFYNVDGSIVDIDSFTIEETSEC